MKIISHFNIIIKSVVLLIAVFLLVGTSNGSQFKIKNSNLNLSTDLTLMALKVEKDIQNDIYSAKETYEGDLTGYGADCPLCGGHLACMPSLDVLHGNVTYNDSTYGLVNIVKANSSYLCNSILEFNVDGEEIYGIILEKDDNQSKDIFEIITTNKVDNSVKEISYTIERYGN